MEGSDRKRDRKRIDKKPTGAPKTGKSNTNFRLDPDKVKAYKSRRTELEKELGIEPKYAAKKPFADKKVTGERSGLKFKKDSGFKREGELKREAGFNQPEGFKREGGFKKEGDLNRSRGLYKGSDNKKDGGLKRESGDFGNRKFDKAPDRFNKSFPKNRAEQTRDRNSDESAGEKKKRYAFDGGPTPEYKFRPPAGRKQPKLIQLKADDGTIRLNKYIADAGVCSRRDADNLIALGEIRVNGVAVTEMGYKVKPTDVVKYGNRTLKREKNVYILMNKPKDFITTLEDPEDRKTVVDLIGKHVKERVYPVGRLDRNTTGLLLLTNDGELAEKLSHPSGKIKKIYEVELDEPLKKEDIDKLKKGVTLEDGPASVDALEVLTPNSKTIGLELHSGRNRIVRRLFEHIGYKVVKLDRVMYADLTKKDLPRGTWRHLTEKEVIRLKYFM